MGIAGKPIRSISLPCNSHPNVDQIVKMLNKVKTWESTLPSSNPSPDMICSGFSHLTSLYESLEDVFSTKLSKTSKVNHTMKWTDKLLDISVKFLDICSNTTDIISQTQQHVTDLGCDLRRNRGCITESIIAKYEDFKKKLKRDIKGSMTSLKQVENIILGCPLMVDSENYHLMCVFREVTSFNILIFRFLLEFLAIPNSRRQQACRWSALSRFVSNGKAKVVPEGKLDEISVNELHQLDVALLGCSSSKKTKFIQDVPKDLEALEATLDAINSQLHSVSRRLITTRVSFLRSLLIKGNLCHTSEKNKF